MAEKAKVLKSVVVVVVYDEGPWKISVEPAPNGEGISITDDDQDTIWIPLAAAEALCDAIGKVVASMRGES